MCQVCGRLGHTALVCWYRFDEEYMPEKTSTAANYSGGDASWYADSGATDHVTGKLDKLALQEKYNDTDHIHTATGQGMDMSYVGHATVPSPVHDIHLNNTLFVPRTKKNLASVHMIASDNDAFLEFHPCVFFFKDRATRTVLLSGRCCNGLYPLPSSTPITQACQVLGIDRPSFTRWHTRLGHPSLPIVQKVISQNNLLCSSKASPESVCDAC